MNKPTRIRIPPRAALAMIGAYVRQRLAEQVRAVAFIVIYLVAFQMLVLRTTPANALRVAAGIGMVVLGLTLFLEGLILGLMPIGERVGLKLPQRSGLAVIVVFGVLLGVGSTLAEPAVAALRVMGGFVKAWEAPLLYHLLQNDPGKLVIAIGIGVGIAVAVGMVRLFYGLSIKPFVYVLVPLLLAVSVYCSLNENLAALLGLAWDAGAVTTGAVTVPLVLALGIGVSRSIGKRKDGSGGFGIIMLASAFPVLTVLALGILLDPALPRAMGEPEFFDPARRAEVMRMFPSESHLLSHAYRRGSDAGRKVLHGDAESHRQAVRSLAEPAARQAILGDMALAVWLRDRASDEERALVSAASGRGDVVGVANSYLTPVRDVLWQESGGALRSVVPLTALLLAVLVLFLRDRLRHNDEIMLGIALSLAGMAFLTSGIRTGLAPLGDEVGRSLPRVFRSEAREQERVLLETFDPEHVFYVYGPDGRRDGFFHLRDRSGTLRTEPYDAARFDAETGRYEHIVISAPLFHANLTFAGIGLVILFAFGLGYGSTLAEPALAALGRKVEDITVGTVKRAGVVRAVSFGVGLGLIAGVARILYNIPTLWLILPPYVLLLWLTRLSEEDFAGIAWDCGGVTTGVVTVPLVMAMGLSIGGELNVVDGFGTLALASAYPIVTVLVYGLALRSRQRRSIRVSQEAGHE